MADVDDIKIGQSEFYSMIDPFAMDLTAVFILMQESIEKLLVQAEKENWDSERLIQEVSNII